MTAEVKDGVGRFPMPRDRWILDQLPEKLLNLFGYRGESKPEKFRDSVTYVYPVTYSSGSAYDLPLLTEYLIDHEAQTAFVLGSTIVLDGIECVVIGYNKEDHPTCTSEGEPFVYTHWEVTVRLPEEIKRG